MSSSNDEDIIFGQELKVLISSADKERATKAVLQFLKGKSDKDLEEDDDIPLINRIPKRGHLNRGSSRGGRRRTVESSPLSNEGKAKKPIVHKDKTYNPKRMTNCTYLLPLSPASCSTRSRRLVPVEQEAGDDGNKYSQRTKLTESEISQLLNKSSSEGSAESSGEESEGNAGDVWTVANRQAGQSPQAVRAVARPIGKPQNLDGEPASNSMSSKKQKVSPIKLMRSKVNGTERSLSPGTQTDEINSVDSPTLSRLRNRSELKRRCWVESEDGSSGDGDMLTGRSETTPKKSTRTPRSIQNQDSPSSLRLRNRSELKRPSWLESEEDSADEIRTSTRKSKTSLRKATPQRTSIPLRDNVLSEKGDSSPARGRPLRDRSELKKPSWLSDSDANDSPTKTNGTAYSPRTRVSLRKQETKPYKESDDAIDKSRDEGKGDSKSFGSPARVARRSSYLDSPRTPVSLRKQVLEANTPRRTLERAGKRATPLKDPQATPHEERSPPLPTTPRSSVRKKLSMTPAKQSTPSTPTSVKRVGHGFLTPVIGERAVKITTAPSNDMDLARTQLHVSSVPLSLPCREKEFNDIRGFLTRKICDKAGGCMYISGVPGTGKTATVHAVVCHLQKSALDKDLPSFCFVEVNGLRLTEPRQAYVRVVQMLMGEKMSPEQAHRTLEKRFCSSKPKMSTVLLIDELDYLCNRRQDVIYNFLEWTSQHNSRFVVLTIANTMDLPERTLKGKVTSRMGLTRLVFHPYSYQQLQEIVMNRLEGSSAFHPDAVQLVARKVAAVSGDARRALDICRRATELVGSGEVEGELSDSQTVTVLHVEKCLNQIFTGARVQAIRNTSLMGQYLLRSIRDETLRTGLEETNLRQVYNHLKAVCALEGVTMPTVGEVLSICWTLAKCGLVLAEKGRSDINKKLSLNVSSDDIHYALSC